MTETETVELPKAAASDEETLAREPNRMEDAQEGPHPQVSQTAWVEWTKPDGDSFLAPLAQSEVFERKGYTRGAEQEIENMTAHLQELYATFPGPEPDPPQPEPEPAPEPEP